VLGDVCTRRCRFCAVPKNREPLPPDPNEPSAVADLVNRLHLRYVVLTMVTRDDLPDGGATHVADVVTAIRKLDKAPVVEILVSDFAGNETAWETVFAVRPDVLNHNVETVPRLYPDIRPQADYLLSLRLLQRAAQAGLPAKSGLMVGLGETEEEVYSLLRDLRANSVETVTIGQYLRPSQEHAPVVEYVAPEVFERYAVYARELGFRAVESAPLVRSSYHADRTHEQWGDAPQPTSVLTV
jgi:lipoic acid synthetase